MRVAIAAALVAVLQSSLPMRSIDRGQNSQIDAARQASARNADEWSKLWTSHAGARARPNVDFSKEVVAAVFLGSRPTAGYGVEIVRARQDGVALVVSYEETRPSPDSVAAQVLTSPYHIVAVPKGSTTDVKFERVE
jgi:protease stability complex PrcB-like protein